MVGKSVEITCSYSEGKSSFLLSRGGNEGKSSFLLSRGGNGAGTGTGIPHP